ncbi:MFS transporter [Tepidiforma thermophila]|uniref:Putative MFS family arabinose efflux permease n=1 Tax=Tepidiforma thermophila (strain KCTC 52669 / CGMCC 1.13589 / G233) TaxID=2761530 RepID=A0A2A9HFU6_TEPT2|nr:MFS transporter [Tepidiforma thermophila]PFG73960.1 putative MFS family arabinose efflux permease [Tepidiforma thermophila]
MNGNVSPASFRIRSLTVPVYLPTFLFAVGQGAVIPVMPLYAIEIGASPAFAGFLVALRGIGTMAFDIPAGIMVSRLGERWAMLAATAVLFFIAVGFALAPATLLLAPLAFLMGCTWAVWMLARLSYATDVSPLDQRGRVLSLIGGSNRIGNFAGPFIGAAGATLIGTDAAFYLQALLALAAAITIFAVVRETPPDHGAAAGGHPVLGVLREHAAVFATAGLASLAIQVLRSSRQAVIPLWGDRIGLDAAQVSIIFGLSSALDMTLFYPVGIVMDRWGRKFAGVPCLLFMSAGMLFVPLSDSYLALLLASLLISFGNGLGSGINMTLGSDFSPAVGRGEFLGAWRLVTDLGTAGGPLLVSAIIGVSSLGAAAVATGGIGLAGAAVLTFLVPEPLRRHRPAAGPAPGA